MNLLPSMDTSLTVLWRHYARKCNLQKFFMQEKNTFCRIEARQELRAILVLQCKIRTEDLLTLTLATVTTEGRDSIPPGLPRSENYRVGGLPSGFSVMKPEEAAKLFKNRLLCETDATSISLLVRLLAAAFGKLRCNLLRSKKLYDGPSWRCYYVAALCFTGKQFMRWMQIL